MGPHEPYWRTNTSFSPPPARWDFQFQSEGLQYDSHDGIPLYGSSTSSNSKESRSWFRGSQLYNHPSASDGAGMFLSSSSDLSQGPQWTPPAIQEIRVDDFESAGRRGMALGPSSFRPTMEGTSENPDSGGSTSFRSDSSESEPKSRSSSHCTFSSRRSFMSKPIHPLSFPRQTPPGEVSDFTVAGLPEFDAATQRGDAQSWSSASSSIDFADVSETFESEICNRPCNLSDGVRCGLCERFLSQRSPWSSRRIVRSGDMPVTGVLSCCHVFHAECLEQTTPRARKNDPPCPLCLRSEEENCPERRSYSRSRTVLPRLRPSSEDGPSRPWGCVQVGDCVEGALHVPPRNSMLLLNRNRVKKNLSLKGNSGKEFPGKLRKSGSYSSQQLSVRSIDQGAVGSSKSKVTAGPSMKN
ncbi:43kDa postsynaptic protein [Parasponia andersonii]|uniref:43kDa postsynaptic protein n=1 Tax=Parasponia andersonii TaxID=3476 RepID=A0A2P5BZG0_PARAD|nr:43kDa postsynaptic protein [Parasponia andersonii]